MKRILNLLNSCLKFTYYKIRGDTKAKYDVVFETVEKMGGVYVKLLQFISLREELFPKSAKLKFLTFYDQVPIEPMDIHKILKNELGNKFSTKFKSIETSPFASGTFGQVYKAVLTNKTKVVIKIKRPNLTQKLFVDFLIIKFLGTLFNLFYPQHFVNISKLIKEFKETTYKELDYLAEVENALYLYHHYQDHPVLHIPFTYKELSTNDLLVQDYVGGLAGTDILRMRAKGVDYKQFIQDKYQTDIHFILKRLSYDSMWQIFSLDKFYSDPHPGNIKILPNNKYAFIDFGIMAESPLNKRDYYNVIKFLSVGAAALEVEGLSEQLLSIGAHYLYACLRTYDRVFSKKDEALSEKVLERYSELIENWREQFRQIEVHQKENYTKVWIDLFMMGEQFNMRMPKGLFSGLRSSALIKSLTSALDPNFHPMKEVFSKVVEDVDEQQLLNLDDIETKNIGVEEAVEVVSNWFGGLAEIDLVFYQDLNNLFV